MTHPDVLPFWHGMAASAAKYKRDAARGVQPPRHYKFDAKYSLTPNEAHETLQFLENFGRHIYIYEDDDPARMDGVQGVTRSQLITEADSDLYDPHKPHWLTFNGERVDECVCSIVIHVDLVDGCIEWQNRDADCAVAEIRAHYFTVAQVLVHEAARKSFHDEHTESLHRLLRFDQRRLTLTFLGGYRARVLLCEEQKCRLMESRALSSHLTRERTLTLLITDAISIYYFGTDDTNLFFARENVSEIGCKYIHRQHACNCEAFCSLIWIAHNLFTLCGTIKSRRCMHA